MKGKRQSKMKDKRATKIKDKIIKDERQEIIKDENYDNRKSPGHSLDMVLHSSVSEDNIGQTDAKV